MGKIRKLGYAAIFTNEFKKSMDFYTDALGFQIDWSDKKKMAMLSVGEFSLFIHPKKTKTKAGAPDFHLHLEVDDIDAFHSILKSKKIKVPKAPKATGWGHKVFHVKDPNGIEWEFYQKN